MDASRRLLFVGGITVFVMAVSLCGCVTKSSADARVRLAYLAGQKSAYEKMKEQLPDSVFIVGPVKIPEVPWVEGLTLAQAIATANYTGRHTPREIIIFRQGEQASINPKDLLDGHAIPLESGDRITIRE